MKQPLKGFLNSKERSILLRELRIEKDSRIKDRYRVILLLDMGWPYDQIATALFIDQTTIRRYYEAYFEAGIDGLVLLHYQGKQSKLSVMQQEELKDRLRKKVYLSAAEVAAYIERVFKVTYTVKGTIDLLHRLGFSYKKPKIVPGKADFQNQQQFMDEYEKIRCKKGKKEKIFFMDGVHPQHNARPAYGWIEKGVCKELKSNTGRQRMNINGVLDPDTLEVIFREDKTINAESTIRLFEEVEKENKEATKITIICDNARYYRSKRIIEFLKNSKIELKFLPPYSPNLNLIERLWRFMHKKVTYNRYYEKFSEFRNAVYQFFENIADFRDELETLLFQKFYAINLQTEVA